MGNLLRALSRLDGAGDWCAGGAAMRGAKLEADVFVDFEDARPESEDDEAVYERAEEVIRTADDVLAALRQYKGATKEIRDAISNPSVEMETKAWTALQPSVSKLRIFFEFSRELETVVPEILTSLCSADAADAGAGASLSRMGLFERLDAHQALVKQFAKILDFVLKFDEAKMTTPAVQNDFSYYRRTIQRNRNSLTRTSLTPEEEEQMRLLQEQQRSALPIDLANQMSLFFAHATPLLNKLSEVTSAFVRSSSEAVAGNATDMLSVVAKVCQKMLEAPDLKSRLRFAETEPFILRVMVATIILYDHVHPTGAFAKGSSVDVKGCVRLLRDRDDRKETESLLNALRYTTRHLNEDATPRSVRAALFEDSS